ncbi:MAG: hypothetical protein WBV74_00335, partial [Pseudonocardiaceae bacterium]
ACAPGGRAGSTRQLPDAEVPPWPLTPRYRVKAGGVIWKARKGLDRSVTGSAEITFAGILAEP